MEPKRSILLKILSWKIYILLSVILYTSSLSRFFMPDLSTIVAQEIYKFLEENHFPSRVEKKQDKELRRLINRAYHSPGGIPDLPKGRIKQLVKDCFQAHRYRYVLDYQEGKITGFHYEKE